MGSCITLKKSNCKNCYKCIRNCPVKSIRFSGEQAHITEEDCILCGQCFVVCPQNAKEIADDTEKIKVMLSLGAPVYVSLAPSFVANYNGVGIESMREALMKLGFTDVEETAIGAHIVKTEYERMIKEDNRDVIISSCCHSVNLLVQKYFPECLDSLANCLSPMQAHCKDIKNRNPLAKTVFIGPCVAKKDEAEKYPGYVDAVLTFEELTNWFNAEGITLNKDVDSNNKSRARLFPTSGGILKTMDCSSADYTYLIVDGTNNCIETLKDIRDGKIHKCFIEMSACAGSCIGGPVMEKHHSISRDYIVVSKYAGKLDFEVSPFKRDLLAKDFKIIVRNVKTPSESEIKAILRQMGKTKPQDELNCASCGYPSCKEKAIAVFQGKADMSMCLPFLKGKAESFSDIIADNTPNGLIVLNDSLEIQQINAAARDIMHIRSASDVLGDQVINILDPKPFKEVLETGRNVNNTKKYLAEYRKYVEQSIIYDRDYHVIICIMKDISDEEYEKKNKEMLNQQTVEIADRVVEKQMRIVQEIASLLGETAAETKIALTKLKESITNE